MNAVGAGLVDDIALAALVEDVDALVEDADAAVSVSYYARDGASRSPDFGAGAIAYTDTATTITAWLSDIALDRRAASPEVQEGDVQLVVAQGALTTAPAVGDRFRVSSVDYAVYGVTRGPLATHYVLRAHRVQ